MLNGIKIDVNVCVMVDGCSEGVGAGEIANTQYRTNGKPIVSYNGNKIALPIRALSTGIGIDVSLFGASTFMDSYLANEAGDIMFFMEYNSEAISSRGNQKYLLRGGGVDMNAYLNSPSGSYSNRVQELYKSRKKLDNKPNIWPLKK